MTRTDEHLTAPQQVASGVVRAVLFCLIGFAGWTLGSMVGIGVGIAIDLVFLADQPSGPGATVMSTVWGTALIGSIAGLVGSICGSGLVWGDARAEAARWRPSHLSRGELDPPRWWI